MLQQPKPNPVRVFASKHAEKVFLGVSVLALTAVLAGRLAATEDPNLERLDLALSDADERLKTPRDEDRPPRAAAWESAAVEPWNRVSAARGADDWAASLYSELRGRALPRKETPVPPTLGPTVELGRAVAQLDGVALAWSVRELTAAEKAEGRKANAVFVDVAAFRIEREVDGRWETLAVLADPKARSYRDGAVEPKRSYRYRVTATSTAPGAPALAALTSEPLRTPGLWRLEFRNPQAGQVWVTIEKYEKSLGATVSRNHLHRAGDAIGRWPEREGDEPTSKHRVQFNALSREVDFDTKTTLVSVQPKRLPVAVKRCKRLFDPATGVPTGCAEVVDAQPFSTHEIVLSGPDGEERFLSPTPVPLDQRCPVHRP